MGSYNILRCGDQYGWAYHNVAKDHAKFSKLNVDYVNQNEVYLDGVDLLYIHSPDISNKHARLLPIEANRKGIKVIGAYAGDPSYWGRDNMKVYSYADLIVTISPQTYNFAKTNYKDTPIVFLPESIDVNFFTAKKEYNEGTLRVGWAGGAHKKVKRVGLAKELRYPVAIQSSWGKELFTKDRTLTHMKDFYHGIDVLIVTSITECMPRVVLEAMACGLPVISTDVGCVKMLLDKEWIVPVSPDEIIIREINSKLDLLQKYKGLRKLIGERNAGHVRKYFSWQNNVSLWDDTFIAVIEGNQKKIAETQEKFLSPFKEIFQEEVDRNVCLNIQDQASYIRGRVVILVDYLQNLDIPFWVVKETCKETIIFKKLQNGNRELSIGVRSKRDKEKILNKIKFSEYKEILKDINLHIYIDEEVTQIKKIPFYNIEVNVPLVKIKETEKTLLNYYNFDNEYSFLKYLVDSNIFFWLLKNTCYDCIIKRKLTHKLLNIGVSTEEDKVQIERIAKESGVTVEVVVEDRKQLKTYVIGESEVLVPIPVISYLEKYTNRSWGNLNKEIKN